MRFRTIEEVELALLDMGGVFVGARPLRVSHADRDTRRHQQQREGGSGGNNTNNKEWGASPASTGNAAASEPFGPSDPSSTTVFVGNLDNAAVTPAMVHETFIPFGDIFSVKMPPGARGAVTVGLVA